MSATLKKFFDSERGATFNLVMSQILWWALGAPVAFQYGYSDETESDGSYPSGNFGSGVFPVTVRAARLFGRAGPPRGRRRALLAGTTLSPRVDRPIHPPRCARAAAQLTIMLVTVLIFLYKMVRPRALARSRAPA